MEQEIIFDSKQTQGYIYSLIDKFDFSKVKVCGNPCCEEIAFEIEKSETRCRNCNGRMISINKQTYLKKFTTNYFQYNYKTGDLIHQEIQNGN